MMPHIFLTPYCDGGSRLLATGPLRGGDSIWVGTLTSLHATPPTHSLTHTHTQLNTTSSPPPPPPLPSSSGCSSSQVNTPRSAMQDCVRVTVLVRIQSNQTEYRRFFLSGISRDVTCDHLVAAGCKLLFTSRYLTAMNMHWNTFWGGKKERTGIRSVPADTELRFLTL